MSKAFLFTPLIPVAMKTAVDLWTVWMSNDTERGLFPFTQENVLLRLMTVCDVPSIEKNICHVMFASQRMNKDKVVSS